jgi:hypothetical protein
MGLNETINNLEGNGFVNILKSIGDWISTAIPNVITWFSSLGSGKLITLILLLIFFYFSLKIVNKIIKIILIIALVVLIATTGFSWVSSLIK